MRLQQILDNIRQHGYKLTPQRRMLLRVLYGADRPLSAAEALEALRREYPELGVDTVYRNLRLLEEIGVVNHIHLDAQQGDLYELSKAHHHHRICLTCGEVVCLDLCPLEELERQLKQEAGFEATGHVFEVYGYCADCAGEKKMIEAAHGRTGKDPKR